MKGQRRDFCYSTPAASPALGDHLARPSVSEVPEEHMPDSWGRSVYVTTLCGLFSETSARGERKGKREVGEIKRREKPGKKSWCEEVTPLLVEFPRGLSQKRKRMGI